jgi:hypothetical protein
MNGARSLISAFHEINRSESKSVAYFTPSLIGMFGSTGIFDSFLSEIDSAMATGKMPASIKKRAANLTGTFIPQVAEYNGIKNPAQRIVTADELRGISKESLEGRRNGVELILSALIAILKAASELDQASA